MGFCGPNTRRLSAFVTAAILIIIGLLAVLLWGALFNVILKKELAVNYKGSAAYNMWKETPIPMYIEFYLFNCTNAQEVVDSKWAVKPKLEECGPYTYSEHHVRVNVEWHDNGTLSYQQKRIWKFLPERTNGSLDDKITNLNVIAATIAHRVRNEHFLVKRGVNFFLKEKEGKVFITRTVNELLFEGYEDELLELAIKLNITGLDIPFDKFGWFFGRNESETYDGNFTMYTGEDNLENLGVFSLWNGRPKTDMYDSYCSYVNGTSGELWPPVEGYNEVSIFSPDICSSIDLKLDGEMTMDGLKGNLYVGDESVFDNGTLYPDQRCFSVGQVVPSGTRNVSACKFGAPAFISYPHFYLADSSYREGIEGMHPNKTLHQFSISLEPHTGIPLQVNAEMQINIYIEPIEGIDFFKDVKKVFVPMLWFRQSATLTSSYASMVTVLLALPSTGTYTGVGVLVLGVLVLLISIFITYKKAWKGQEGQQLLPQQSL